MTWSVGGPCQLTHRQAATRKPFYFGQFRAV